MADDLNQTASRDDQRVNCGDETELRAWSTCYNTTADRIREAVRAVGDHAEKVQAYLSRK